MAIRIENEQLLTERFGRWPSFHDAEVIRVRFEREGTDVPFMECDIHVFEMTDQLDATGHYVLRNHTVVTIRFCQIGLEEFKWWNHQNVLWSLGIEPAEASDPYASHDWSIHVTMPSSYGCEAKLWCTSVKVLKAEDLHQRKHFAVVDTAPAGLGPSQPLGPRSTLPSARLHGPSGAAEPLAMPPDCTAPLGPRSLSP